MPAKMSDGFLLYCKVRRAWELKKLGPVSMAEITRFKEVRSRSTNRRHQDLFHRWVANSERSQHQLAASIAENVDCVLRVHQTEHFYGGIHNHRRGHAG
jgi:hypothetical protein